MVEDQAIGRVLRLGQKKEVKVIRYIIKDSVEEVGEDSYALASKLLTQIRSC